MSWNIGDNRNLFLKLKTKLGLYHDELRSKPKDSPEKITLTMVQTQELPDIEKVDSKDETSCSKWTMYNGRRKASTLKLIQTSSTLSYTAIETTRISRILKWI